MIFPRMAGKEPDVEKARDTLHNKMPRFFDYLEGQVKGKEFVAGDGFSIGDIAIVTQMINLRHAAGRVDAERWPALAGYLERMFERGSVKARVEDETVLFPPFDVEL